MKAVRVHGPGDLRIEDVPDPRPAHGQVLVAVEAAGMCATDVHILHGTFPCRYPLTIGHEIAGRIVEVGDGVDPARVGASVTVEPHEYCRECLYCRIGQEHMCTAKEAYGVHVDGGMAEYLAVPSRLAYDLPEGVSAALGSMTEPIACSIHAMDRLGAVSGLPVAVYGCGPAGAVLVALCRRAGLSPIVVLDPRAERRDLALRVGADIALDPTTGEIEDIVRDLTGGYGFSYQIDAVGSPRVIEQAVARAARRGTVLFFGVAAPGDPATVYPQEIYAKELSLLGTAINPYTHHRAAALLPQLPLTELRTATYHLTDAAAALEAQQRGEVDKIFLAPGESLAGAGAGNGATRATV
ncbi:MULTISPECIES: alcohol dehydrogenase catalytic domain-containing protein [Pseudonocardia]|uniref:D-arabitol-phosphate dehydrogenase n=2 Tax=Pseudonocardia TaxID=1847 RepID=A0A1Y2MHS8_PSEAH|nr:MULTISPECIES: alcohol dehydrogenase catalytic domain-containing protein [Pseudonocardia]OSY34823.1 D-arabitol-phosphate dehydrogenase [Pseudonocardia autotrophica]TDN73020.1 2-desacetyl-2-hydroxyethyl bacteriochlorophyllide A dehydrogenase [Pseudonocardia autotrophica]BBG03739.1 alcohol dehydrogenase [Pseudonocardia autotrophica]GEC29278.1 alcohol dehydrogenase [Pseudonocardia saturnea]